MFVCVNVRVRDFIRVGDWVLLNHTFVESSFSHMSVRVLGIVGERDIAGVKYSLYQTDFLIDFNFPIKRHNIKFTLTCTCR